MSLRDPVYTSLVLKGLPCLEKKTDFAFIADEVSQFSHTQCAKFII